MSQLQALSNYGNTQTQVATESAVRQAPALKTQEKEVKQEKTDVNAVNEAVAKINGALHEMRREERQFQVDEDLGKLVVKIINSDTRELVRQIPTEEALALSKRMQDVLKVMYG